MPADLAKVKELFVAILEMSAAERAAYLDTACAGDTALRAEIEAMLQSHANSGELLPRSPAEMLRDSGDTDADATAAFPPEPRGSATQIESGAGGAHDLTFLAPSSKPGHIGRLGHYEIMEVLGKGGFGIVLKAFDEKLHRVVAIKVLSPAYAANGSARKRFIREARAAAAVKNEHVVGIYEVQEDAQPPYLVMECIDGNSLQDKLDKHGSLGVTEILRIGMQIAEGLAAAHKQGKVHRDIKPANILLENGVERVKITDFGLARAVDDASVTQSGTVAGTPMYMSPEQAEGLAIDHRSDLFSLGTVLYAMCTGHPPFRASGTHAVLKRVIDASPRPIREVNNEIPDWLCDIIGKLHAKKPEDRFQTAKDVAELLGQHLAHLEQPDAMPRPASVILPPRVEKSKGGWARMGRVGAILAGVAIAVALLLASPFLYQYAMNQGTLIFSGTMDPNLGKILVKQQGETVAELTITNSMVRVPAGDYQVEVVCKEGLELSMYRIGSTGSGATDWQIAKGPSFPVRLARADHVSINVELEKKAADPMKTPTGPGWVQLFNGKDLKDWEFPDYNRLQWSLENGMLVAGKGSSAPMYFKSREFADFHLRLEVECRQAAVIGVGFRTAPGDKSTSWKGYEIPIGTSRLPGAILMPSAKSPKTLRPSTVLEKENLPPSQLWEVIAQGSKIKVKLDGIVVNDAEDSSFSKGRLYLIQRFGNVDARFRKIEIKELPPEPAVVVMNALQFDGQKSHVSIPSLRFATDEPITLEAWVKFDKVNGRTETIASTYSANSAILLCRTMGAGPTFLARRDLKSHFARTDDKSANTDWAHLAGVWDGKEARLYTNGKLQSTKSTNNVLEKNAKVQDQHFLIGAEKVVPSQPVGFFFHGLMGPIRISNSARYAADFTPDANFQLDTRTIALYRMDQASGDKLLDSTSNNYHGTIVDAKWVTVPRPAGMTEPGWVQLFNGKDLSQWQALGPDTAFAWNIEDQILVGRSKPAYKAGIHLKTAREFGPEFHLRTEVKASDAAGIPILVYAGGQPQGFRVHLNSSANYATGTAVLYNKNFIIHRAPKDLVKPDEWYRLEIICYRNRLRVRLNDQNLGDSAVPGGIEKSGIIGLFCANNSSIHIRKMEINPEIKKLPPEEPGWVPLFNGKDLTGWQVSPAGTWKVEKRHLIGQGDQAKLRTDRFDFADFHLRIETKYIGGDGMLLLRGQPANIGEGYEIFMNNRDHDFNTGALMTILGKRSESSFVKQQRTKPDEWFSLEITARGKHLQTFVNGEKAADFIDPMENNVRKGWIRLNVVGKNAELHIKKIEVKELPTKAP